MNDSQADTVDRGDELPDEFPPSDQPPPLDVLLIDASALNRSCFSAGIDHDGSIRLVACAAIDQIPPAAFARGMPDIVILRLIAEEIAEADVADRLQRLDELFPGAAIILIIPTAEPRHILTALQHEILGLTTDQLSMASTIEVMRLVHAGMVVYPPMLFESLRTVGTADENMGAGSVRSGINKLTKRQYEVLRLLAGGMPNKAIAQELGISDSTVKVHIRAIMERLGLVNRTQAAARFLRSQF
ncbi:MULTISPECIES: helix-turn-helix transcriptional regulator [unclassified Sphingomonas]|uniref:helix-turn-helix transcriptional regulator n=1 Tax=unclassified Sphingomonas TaxID=196159 RepID=UPI0006F23463|nr:MULTISPECIES: response regulator transcription factor [unclassified Sphingomonas]